MGATPLGFCGELSDRPPYANFGKQREHTPTTQLAQGLVLFYSD